MLASLTAIAAASGCGDVPAETPDALATAEQPVVEVDEDGNVLAGTLVYHRAVEVVDPPRTCRTEETDDPLAEPLPIVRPPAFPDPAPVDLASDGIGIPTVDISELAMPEPPEEILAVHQAYIDAALTGEPWTLAAYLQAVIDACGVPDWACGPPPDL